MVLRVQRHLDAGVWERQVGGSELWEGTLAVQDPPAIWSKLGSGVRLRPDVCAALSRNSAEASWESRKLVLKVQLEPPPPPSDPETQVALWRAGEKQRSSEEGSWCGALCEELPAKSQGEEPGVHRTV